MLVGYGIRLGAPTRAYYAISAIVLGADASLRSGAIPLLAGVLLHIAFVLACGAIYTHLVGESRQHPVAWAIAVGGLAAILCLIIARARAGTIALALTPGNLIAVGAVLAFTLPIGMRFALSRL
jgi:hypothetical protein